MAIIIKRLYTNDSEYICDFMRKGQDEQDVHSRFTRPPDWRCIIACSSKLAIAKVFGRGNKEAGENECYSGSNISIIAFTPEKREYWLNDVKSFYLSPSLKNGLLNK